MAQNTFSQTRLGIEPSLTLQGKRWFQIVVSQKGGYGEHSQLC